MLSAANPGIVGDWVSIWSGPSPAGTETCSLANRSAHGMRCWSTLMPLAWLNFCSSWSMIWPSAPVRPFQYVIVTPPAPGFAAAAAGAAAGAVVAAAAAAGLVGSAAAGLDASAGLLSAGLASAGFAAGGAAVGVAWPQAASSAAEPAAMALRTNRRRDVRIGFPSLVFAYVPVCSGRCSGVYCATPDVLSSGC